MADKCPNCWEFKTTKCNDCNGHGRSGSFTCDACGGSGRVCAKCGRGTGK